VSALPNDSLIGIMPESPGQDIGFVDEPPQPKGLVDGILLTSFDSSSLIVLQHLSEESTSKFFINPQIQPYSRQITLFSMLYIPNCIFALFLDL
jgi:hypothetical protein